MAKEGEADGTNGVIPYFFYDIIAKIIPGAWLFIGSFWTWYGFGTWDGKVPPSWMQVGVPEHLSEAAVSIATGLSFIVFLGASSFAGFLLAALSYQITERFVWNKKLLWVEELPLIGKLLKRQFELDITWLEKCLGSKNKERITHYFQKIFEFELEDGRLEEASFLCSSYIWNRSVTLGIMTARFDAEKVGIQSSLLVSIILLFENIIYHCLPYGGRYTGWYPSEIFWVACLLGCIVSCWRSFDYHRQKRLRERFQIFLVLANKPDPQGNAS